MSDSDNKNHFPEWDVKADDSGYYIQEREAIKNYISRYANKLPLEIRTDKLPDWQNDFYQAFYRLGVEGWHSSKFQVKAVMNFVMDVNKQLMYEIWKNRIEIESLKRQVENNKEKKASYPKS